MLTTVEFALTVLDGVRWWGHPVPGDRPQALLAALVRGGGDPVGTARLIDDVWGDDPPTDSGKALQVLVSRTRAACAAELIISSQRGYRLGLPAKQVDALALKDAVTAADAALRNGRTEEACRLAEAALAIGLQRPDPEQPAPLAALRTEAERLHGELTGILGLALSRAGDHASALPILESIADLGRETTVDETALAAFLHSEAAVRGPAAALDRYERYRSDLADRLGSDPGPELRRMHAHLLALDRPVRAGLHYDPTRLIGREDDVRAVLGLLTDARVVSIIGPGGLGKTRLAHAVGRVAGQPAVHLVELVGIADDDNVITEVASALDIRDSVAARRSLTNQQRIDLRSRLFAKLSAASTLLIIDNCEHVIDGVARLVSLLIANTPELRVLTTSRAPLGIAAERAYPLPQLSHDDGIALFRERATAARPGVVLEDEPIGELVDRLDGLPLAVELAAAKVRVMSVAEITERLADRFALLRSRDPSVPDRHRTLEAVIEWSWNLLDDEERQALRRLAVFRDNFGADGATAVIGRDPLPTMEILSIMESLVDQSLLVVEEGETVRFRMLETVREFGLLQLASAGEEAAIHRAARDWGMATCQHLLAVMHGPEQFACIDRMRVEEGNLNELLRRAVHDHDPDAAVVLMATLGGFWGIVGDHQRVIAQAAALGELLAGYDPPSELRDATRLTSVYLLANTVVYYGDEAGEVFGKTLRRLGTGSTDPMIAATCRAVLVLVNADSVPERIDRLKELARQPDRAVALQANLWLGHLAENDGDPRTAIAACEAGLALCGDAERRDADGPWTRGAMQSQLAGLSLQVGDWRAAQRYAIEALPIMERLHSLDDAAHLRGLLVMTALWGGDMNRAERLLDELRRMETRWITHGDTLVGSAEAELAIARGDVAAGLDSYRSTLQRMRDMPMPFGSAPEFAPWLLFTESAALRAMHRFGAEADAEALFGELVHKLRDYLAPGDSFVDYPIAGTVLFALGTVLAADRPELAVRLLAYSEIFSVVRNLPSTNADEVINTVERALPGELTKITAELSGSRPRDLHDQVRTLITEIIERESRSA